MPLIHDGIEGWKINKINRGKPYHVELVGPYKLPQVEDAAGTCALIGPGGSVFCASTEQAERLCEMANNDELPRT